MLKCPLCGDPWDRQENWKIPLGGYDLRQCVSNCYNEPDYHPPVLLSWQWESEEEYERLYTEDLLYHKAEAERNHTRSFWHRDGEHMPANMCRLRFIEGCVGAPALGTVADIGTGTGALPSLCRAYWRGCTAYGWEPNASMVAQGKCLDRPVFQGTYKDVGPPLHGVFLVDVLEHLVRPADCLEHIIRRISPEGWLYIEMPEWTENIGSRHVKPREHLCLYSRAAAEQFYEDQGWRIVGFQRPLGGTLEKMAHLLVKREGPWAISFPSTRL